MKYFDLRLRNYNRSEIECIDDNNEECWLSLTRHECNGVGGQSEKEIDITAAAAGISTHPSVPQIPVKVPLAPHNQHPVPKNAAGAAMPPMLDERCRKTPSEKIPGNPTVSGTLRAQYSPDSHSSQLLQQRTSQLILPDGEEIDLISWSLPSAD